MLKQLSNLIKNTEVIGLDIGSHSVKIVEIDHRKKGSTLTTFAIAHHSLSLDGYWDSNTLRKIATLIEDLINKSRFAGIKTVLSIRSKDVYVTTMDFDTILSDQDIKAEINKQAPYFLPLPPSEMRLSFDVLKLTTPAGKKRVVINATPDYIIENSRNLLEHLNLDGEAIENATLSQIRANLSYDPSTVLLADLGGHFTTLSLVSNYSLRSSTYIPTGTESISTAIAEIVGTQSDIGEAFMRDLNLVDLAHLPKPFLDYLAVLKDEIQTFVELNMQAGQTPTKIVFTGGGANTPGLLAFFESYVIPCALGEPLKGLTLDAKIIPHISPVQHQLAVAIGLAKRSDIL